MDVFENVEDILITFTVFQDLRVNVSILKKLKVSNKFVKLFLFTGDFR